ncbi:MAG: hypothetical protein ACLSB9_05065 [Hydrogeniiclostridium mannosilyticum]
MIVCDEAHKMSATVWGGEVNIRADFVGRLLSNITKNFLLLTATLTMARGRFSPVPLPD